MDLYRKITSLEMEVAVLKQSQLSEDVIRCIVHDELRNIRHRCPTCQNDRIQVITTVTESGHAGVVEPGPQLLAERDSSIEDNPSEWEQNRITIDFEERERGIPAAELAQQFFTDETSSSSNANMTDVIVSDEVKPVMAESAVGVPLRSETVSTSSSSKIAILDISNEEETSQIQTVSNSSSSKIEIVDISNEEDMTLMKASVDDALWRNGQLTLKLKRLEDEMINGIGERLKLQLARNKTFLESNRRFKALSSNVTPMDLKAGKELSGQTIKSPPKYGCAKCPGLFPSTEMLNTHVCVNEREKIYKCPFCDRQFPTKQDFTRHLRDFHAL